MSRDVARSWANACLALNLLAVDPVGLRGVALRARSGPVRDVFLDLLSREIQTVRIHPAMSREALFGGLDIAATLSAGRIMRTSGLMAGNDACLLLAMAERCGAELAAEMAQCLERGGRRMVLLDEGAEPGETAPRALMERLALHVCLDEIGRQQAQMPETPRIDEARLRLADITATDDALRRLVVLAARLGVDSLRAPYLALKAAKANAALRLGWRVEDEDIAVGAGLVLAPRATVIPEPPDDPNPGDHHPESREGGAEDSRPQGPPDEILVEAVRPQLPGNMIDGLRDGGHARVAKGAGVGRKHRSNRRGRPLPSRPGRPGGDARVDLAATLRTAAPWQGLRGRDGSVKVLPSDIRLKRYEEKSDRLLIFAVDASGSAAMARLGDAKGAVEILLSRAYASRDHVALIAFRGNRADLLLPPTRSLLQAKRRLTALPGGGGTPLATGLRAAGDLALQARGQGLTPILVLLTDGRANVALDGSGNRAKAREHTTAVARCLAGEGLPCVVLDTGNRPQAVLADLARILAAQYLPLPRADSATLGKTIFQTIRDGLDA